MSDTESTTLDQQIDILRNSITAGPPYCQGILPVSAKDLILFYGTVGNADRIDLTTATLDQLQRLADACQPATFGYNQENVYDETYRKAGKLDTEDFSLKFDAANAGLLDIVHSELAIDRLVKDDAIRAELYKLNVYGPGSFFKPHVDTPHNELQFGSLVIVFPTAHEGGELKIRYAKDTPQSQANPEASPEWTFDSNALLVGCAEPSIAYVAFFSDIEHEVMSVVSGYRITITYNLFWAAPEEQAAATGFPTIPPPISTTEDSFRNTLRVLLGDPTFLPDGAYLMFGMTHKYPLAVTPEQDADAARQALVNVTTRLKGNDAVIFKAMQDFSLCVDIKTVYSIKEKYSDEVNYVACDRVVPLENEGQIEGSLWCHLCEAFGGILLTTPQYHSPTDEPVPINPLWVVGTPEFTHVKSVCMTYGNDALLEVVYWRLYMLVRVGPPGDRGGEPRPAELPSESEVDEHDESRTSLFSPDPPARVAHFSPSTLPAIGTWAAHTWSPMPQ